MFKEHDSTGELTEQIASVTPIATKQGLLCRPTVWRSHEVQKTLEEYKRCDKQRGTLCQAWGHSSWELTVGGADELFSSRWWGCLMPCGSFVKSRTRRNNNRTTGLCCVTAQTKTLFLLPCDTRAEPQTPLACSPRRRQRQCALVGAAERGGELRTWKNAQRENEAGGKRDAKPTKDAFPRPGKHSWRPRRIASCRCLTRRTVEVGGDARPGARTARFGEARLTIARFGNFSANLKARAQRTVARLRHKTDEASRLRNNGGGNF